MDIKINVNNIDILQEISVETFKDTFAKQNTEENMKAYLSEHIQ